MPDHAGARFICQLKLFKLKIFSAAAGGVRFARLCTGSAQCSPADARPGLQCTGVGSSTAAAAPRTGSSYVLCHTVSGTIYLQIPLQMLVVNESSYRGFFIVESRKSEERKDAASNAMKPL